MSKTIKRAATMLIALVLMVCGLFLIKDIPITAEANYTPTGPLQTGWYSFKLGASFGDLNFMGDWGHNASSIFTIHWMSTTDSKTNGKIVYCIEPGVNLAQTAKYTENGRTYFDENAGSWNNTLAGDELSAVMAHILSFGWHGNYTNVTSGANAKDNLERLMATQYLIWETIVGERDASFNHVDPGSKLNKILDMLPTNMPDSEWRSKVMKYYEEYEKKVQDSFKIPSFAGHSVPTAPVYQTYYIDLGGVGTGHDIVLTDTNNVLQYFDVSINKSGVTFTKEGNKLTIHFQQGDYDANAIVTLTRKDFHPEDPVVWVNQKRQDFVSSYGETFEDPLQAFVKTAYRLNNFTIYKETDPAGGQVEGWEFSIYKMGVSDPGIEGPSIGDQGMEGPTIGDEVPEGAPGVMPIPARTLYAVVRTDSTGKIMVNLPAGTYYIEETGYPSNTDPKYWDVTLPAYPSKVDGVAVDSSKPSSIKVGADVANPNLSVTFTNPLAYGTLKIRKSVEGQDFDEATLYGWSFSVYKNEACTQLATRADGSQIKNVVTNSAGLISEGLEEGYYWVKENAVYPPGEDSKNWILDTHVEKVHVTTGNIAEAKFKNTYVTSGYGEIIKKSTNGGTVTGWKFSIYKNSTCTTLAKTADGATAQNLTTNASGKINVELEPGEYWIKEVGYPSSFTAAAQGYWKMDTTVRKITVSSGSTASVTFNNEWTGKVNFKKTSTNGGTVEGWKITVYYDSACTQKIGTYTTGSDGTILTSGWSPGTYYAKETDYPSSFSSADKAYWELDTAVKPFTVSAGATATVTFNNKWLGKARIVKTATNGGTVAGWKITAYYDSACTRPINTYTTGADGTITTGNWKPGTYYFKETDYPSTFSATDKTYWVMDTAVKSAKVEPGKTVSVSFQNEWYGKGEIIKTTTPSGTVAGWQFTIYSDAACRNAVETITTDASGKATSRLLNPGQYWVKETGAPAGEDTSYWVMDTAVKTVVVQAGKTSSVSFNNHWHGKVSIDKALENPEAGSLEGWLFTIYTDSACTKIAKFADGTLAENLRTDSSGHILSEKFERGQYWVKEVGYEGEVEWDYWFCSSKNNPQQVTVTEGATANVKFRNALRPGTITVTKVSDDGSVLAGVQLMLEWYDETAKEWKPVTSRSTASHPYVTRGTCTSAGLNKGVLTTGADGTVTFDGLYPLVQYRVTEVATLSGYQLLTEPVFVGKLTLEENLIKAFKPVNHKLVTLPVTGRYDILIFSAAAIVLTAAGTVVLMVTKRRRMDRE